MEAQSISWNEGGEARTACWRSERGAPPPKKVVIADDRMRADDGYGLAAQGAALLWRGDFQNARQMLKAMGARFERPKGPKPRGDGKNAAPSSSPEGRRNKNAPSPVAKARDEDLSESFNLHRQARAQRARTLGMLLIPLEADYSIPLRRAPDVREACLEAYGPADGPSVVSLRELLGVIGAHEWRRNGIEVPALGARIHPHYGVFAPIRSEYVDLVAKAPLPAALAAQSLAFDIGTGTGVIAAVLAKRGIHQVIATDLDPRALACAKDNRDRLQLQGRIEIVSADLFPEGQAALVVCNPPWLPARPSSPLEHGIYDPESRMLHGFLDGLAAHLLAGGEGWLILSDLAEHLGLRTRDALLARIHAAGLHVLGRLEAKPMHPRALDASDPLHRARKAEVTTLWRLGAGTRQPAPRS